MKNILSGVQHIQFVATDVNYSVLCVPNSQVLANVLDTFKQGSGIAFATYKKPKDFGERSKSRFNVL